MPRKERLKQEVEDLLNDMPAFVPKQPGLDEATPTKPVGVMTSPQRSGAQQLEDKTEAGLDEIEVELQETIDNEGGTLDQGFVDSC